MCLDPRFKLTLLSDKDAQERWKQKMKEEMQDLGEASVSAVTDETTPSYCEPPRKVYKTTWEKIFGSQQEGNDSMSKSLLERAEKELDSYMHCPVLDIESSALKWWKTQHKQFPLLARMVQKYLLVVQQASLQSVCLVMELML